MGQKQIKRARKLAQRRAAEEKPYEGTTIYVHANGDDENDGLTPATAVRTLRRAEELGPVVCPNGLRFDAGSRT